jgi:hypothetical protein
LHEYTRQHFFDENEETGVIIHIFEECALGVRDDIRLEVEFPQGVINVPWPRAAFAEEMLRMESARRVTDDGPVSEKLNLKA